MVDSRLASDGSAVRRRRECEACNYRFSTNEEVELLDLTIIKRNGRHEAYSKEKLERGLKRSLDKRPVTEAAFRGLVHTIEREIQRKKTNEITSAELGDIVMEGLKGFDKIAYIRFASVYRQFEDVASFSKELERLMPRTRKAVQRTRDSGKS